MKYIKPVVGFITLFQRYLKLIDKIRFTGSIIRLMYICSDACTASKKLIYDGRSFFAFSHRFTKIDYGYRKRF